MKKLIVVLFISVLTKFSIAQVNVSILAGGHQSSIIETNSLPNWNETKKYYSPLTGFHAGFMADMPVNKKATISFQPAVIYYGKGQKFFKEFDTSNIAKIKDSSFKRVLNYIEMPFNFVGKLKLSEKIKFIIGAGPYFSFFISGREESLKTFRDNSLSPVSTKTTDLPIGKAPKKYSSTDFGVNFIAGFEIGRVAITANAGRSISNIYQAAYKGSFKNQVLGVTLSVALTKPEVPEEEELPLPLPVKEKDTLTAIVKEVKKEIIADADGDGIVDKDDRCPDVKGVQRYFGCPVPDSDKDGVNDESDRCPKEPGKIENNGCPVIETPVLVPDTTHYIIYFEPNKSNLKSEAFNILQNIVRELKANPKLVVSIKGYTDNVGSDAANLKLSTERANVAAGYITSYYISKNRVYVTAFGKQNPVADINDPLLQWKNRRVEISTYEVR